MDRIIKIQEAIKDNLAEIIQLSLKDPRIPEFLSVVDVEVARDLSQAKVFVSSLGDDAELAKAIEGLTSAAGFLRRQLRERITVHTIPRLHFEADRSISHGVYMTRLIDKVMHPETSVQETKAETKDKDEAKEE
jgi:ribosome-binding factor A